MTIVWTSFPLGLSQNCPEAGLALGKSVHGKKLVVEFLVGQIHVHTPVFVTRVDLVGDFTSVSRCGLFVKMGVITCASPGVGRGEHDEDEVWKQPWPGRVFSW